MIDLRHESPQSRYQIRGYKSQELLINETKYSRSLIVCSHTLIENWRPQSLQELQASDWEVVLSLNPKVVLLGAGDQLKFPPTELMAPLIEKKIGFEIMDNAAAARTFSILIAEDREVVAAFILG